MLQLIRDSVEENSSLDYKHAAAVAVPQSTTAHQATDKRYYRRFNVCAVALAGVWLAVVCGRLLARSWTRDPPRVSGG